MLNILYRATSSFLSTHPALSAKSVSTASFATLRRATYLSQRPSPFQILTISMVQRELLEAGLLLLMVVIRHISWRTYPRNLQSMCSLKSKRWSRPLLRATIRSLRLTSDSLSRKNIRVNGLLRIEYQCVPTSKLRYHLQYKFLCERDDGVQDYSLQCRHFSKIIQYTHLFQSTSVTH
jgi:hypothetical protein